MPGVSDPTPSARNVIDHAEKIGETDYGWLYTFQVRDEQVAQQVGAEFLRKSGYLGRIQPRQACSHAAS